MKSVELVWHEWFDDEKSLSFKKRLDLVKSTLIRNRLYLPVLIPIIKEAISDEMVNINLPDEIIQAEKVSFLNKFKLNSSSTKEEIEAKLRNYFISLEEMDKIIEVESKCYSWASNIWHEDTSALYLEKKESFDEVTFRIIRVEKEKKNYANELYHKLKNNEISFNEACKTYGSEEDKLNKGKAIKKSINKLSKKLATRIQKLQNNGISTPFQIDEWIVIVELLDKKTITLNDDIRKILIKEKFDSFLQLGAIKIASETIANPSGTKS